MKERKYKVRVAGNGVWTSEPHPKAGWHEVKVCQGSWNEKRGTRFVVGDDFGCSRDYFTETDSQAIACLMSEHGLMLCETETL